MNGETKDDIELLSNDEDEELKQQEARKNYLAEIDKLDENNKLEFIKNVPDTELIRKFEYYSHLIKGRFLPEHISRPETAFTIEQMGKELKFPLMQAFHYIIPISGKLSLSAKAIGGILKREGIKYQCTKYDVYVYSKNGEIIENKYPLYPPNSDEHKNQYICRLTEITFERIDPDGYKTKEIVTFSTIDAKAQLLLNNPKKPQWTKMLPEMMYARCLSRGANIIAPDKTMGLYSTEEMLDGEKDESRIVNEDGKLTTISIDEN
jgi:hypothetical protein